MFKQRTEEFFLEEVSEDQIFDIDEYIKVSCNREQMNRYFVDEIVDVDAMATFRLLEDKASEEVLE